MAVRCEASGATMTADASAFARAVRLQRDVTLANWLEAPYHRTSFQHVREVLPTARVCAGERANVLPEQPRDLDSITFVDRTGSQIGLDAHLSTTAADGICVVKAGHIVYERYLNGMAPDTLHLLMSVSKSFCGALVGISVAAGRVGLSDRVDAIAPELVDTALGGTTLQALIDMTSAVDFVESYNLEQRSFDANGQPIFPVEWARGKTLDYERHGGIVPHAPGRPAGVIEYARGLGSRGVEGEAFEYRSAFTNVVAYLLERINGIRYPDLLSRDLWVPMGQEFEADLALDRVGFPVVEGGMSCSLRDLARFGALYARQGMIDDQSIVPERWVADTFTGDAACRAAYLAGPHAEQAPSVMYRNAFWVYEPGAVISGLGIHGQFCYVDRSQDVAIARFSSYANALPFDLSDEIVRSFEAIVEAIA